MPYYAQLDDENYCIGISDLKNKIELPNMIEIENMDYVFLGQQYDLKTNKWTKEYRPHLDPNQNLSYEDKIRDDLILELARNGVFF